MNVKILFAVLAASINFGLILFVSFRNRQHTVYKTFILMSFCLLMWNLRVIISNLAVIENTETIYFNIINRIFFPAVTVCLYLLPVSALHFSISFIGIRQKIMGYIVRACYVLAALLSLIYILNIFSSQMYDYILEFFVLPLFIAALFLIGRAYVLASEPLERARLNLLFVGGSVGVVCAIMEDFSPALGINAFGIGNAGNAFYSLLVAVSLFRHRLFDVKLSLRRAAGFLLTLLFLFTLWYFFSRIFRFSTLAPYVYLFIIVAVLLISGNRIMFYAENILFKKLKSSDEMTAEMNSIMEKARNTDDLLQISSEILRNNLHILKTAFYLENPNTRVYQLVSPVSSNTENVFELGDSNRLVEWFSRGKKSETVIRDELRHVLRFSDLEKSERIGCHELLEDMEVIGYEACAPMMLEKKLLGLIFLGMKESNQAFSESDVRFVKHLAHSCAVWLQRFKLLDQIRRLEQLATLGEMAAFIAHEVKNPLAIIRSSSQLIRAENEDSKFVRLILEECNRLDRVVTRLLDFAKTSSPAFQKVNIKQEVTECVHQISNDRNHRNVDISISCQDNIPPVRFDTDHFRQIIMNLLLNAIEAMKNGGKIDIVIAQDGFESIVVGIKDNGPGITHEHQAKIFEPFYSTKAGGTGLGLPITMKLLELNNSTMKIVSEPNKGCEIKISIPCWKEKHE